MNQRAEMDKAVFITRSDIGWYSPNANVRQKAREVAARYNATLCVSRQCRVPDEIAALYRTVIRFQRVFDLIKCAALRQPGLRLFTGFDFPCMAVAWRLKRKFGCRWTVFLWDPPCLLHRDAFPPLRWLIDLVFRFFARRCDKLVLNIHPGLLDEIGYKPREGQLELRMQDAWEGRDFGRAERAGRTDGFAYDFGVLSNWSKGKGGDLMAEAMRRLPGKKCLWIGNPPKNAASYSGMEFAGHLPQDEAFRRLCGCRFLVVPYLPVKAFKWNYPLKLFEYLQIGRPVIASDNPGNAAVAAKYKGRIVLFKSGDLKSLVAALRDAGRTE